MSKVKAPNIGDKITHFCRLNGEFKGEVIELLTTQFVYKTVDGQERFCLFRESWKKINEK
jgi:hypothetical protein